MQYVTATDWAVSYTTGTSIRGCILTVHRSVPRDPTPDNPITCRTEYAIQREYPDYETARAAALEGGYIRPWYPTPRGWSCLGFCYC